MPFPPSAVRPGSPKLDPSEVYLKSKTIYEDKRKYIIFNLKILNYEGILYFVVCAVKLETLLLSLLTCCG